MRPVFPDYLSMTETSTFLISCCPGTGNLEFRNVEIFVTENLFLLKYENLIIILETCFSCITSRRIPIVPGRILGYQGVLRVFRSSGGWKISWGFLGNPEDRGDSRIPGPGPTFRPYKMYSVYRIDVFEKFAEICMKKPAPESHFLLSYRLGACNFIKQWTMTQVCSC